MEHYQLVIRDYDKDSLGIGNILKCLVSALSINEDTFIQCYPDYRYGAYDTILDARFIYDPVTNPRIKPEKEHVPVRTCRFMLLYFEEAYQEDLPNEEVTLDPIHPQLFHWYFSKSKRIDWHYEPEKIDVRVRARIMETMSKLVFTPIVTYATRQWTALFKGNGSSLGLSIRTWKSYHESNVGRPYSMDTYTQKIAEVMEQNPGIRTIVLSVDHEDAVGEYMAYLTKTYPMCSYVVLQHPTHLNPIQYAMTKVLTLAECTYFIGNRISTFTELVFWFGHCKPKVYPVF